MEKKRIGIITLAITFIVVGVTYLIYQFVDFNINNVLNIIWPCIIILLGIEILFTKAITDRRKKDIKYVYSKSSIFIIIVMIFILKVLSYAEGDFGNIMFISNYSKYHSEYTKEYKIPLNNQQKLELDNEYGEVYIKKGDVDKINIEAKITIKNNDEEYADKLAAELIRVKEYDTSIDIKSGKTSYNKRLIKSISIDYDITLPKDIKLDVVNGFGDVEIKQVKAGIKVTNRHGDICLTDTNEIEAISSHGDMTVNNVNGDVKLNNRHGKIKVFNIQGNADIDSEHSEIDLENIERDVKLRASFREIKIKNIKGKVNVNSSHSRIEADEVLKGMYVENEHGNIEIKNVKERCDIRNRHGHIDIDLEDKANDTIKITNEHGDVNLKLNEEQGGEFDIFTEYGTIKDVADSFELNDLIKVDKNIHKLKTKINNDKGKFNIRVRHGDINLTK
ncbi:hypothetical protein PV797_06465 [Clostridiaceae bacterium M8S5]|nr:hypothetical protein PV797_06465 [Clostridiaceae bacterium M8S5]